MTTAPGSASAWSRAARFGVSPTTASSCAAPSPISSPTMTTPVAMPTRAARPLAGRLARACPTRLDQLQASPHRPLGLVLVRLRPAEIGEHAITHVLGDMPAPALDHLGAGGLIGPDHLPHVLGIEPRRELSRAHQIEEHHRQLPPLGLRSGCGLGGWGPRKPGFGGKQVGLAIAQGSDRLQQQTPMAE